MDINKKNRTQLKTYFKSNATPTEQNFADFIDAGFNQAEDGIAKSSAGCIAIESASVTEELIHFYKSFRDNNPSWTLAQKVGDKSGFTISNMPGDSKLFIDTATGNIGVGGLNMPNGKLHIFEKTGATASPSTGSLILEHGNAGGQSSMVFRNKTKAADHWGYINYLDDTLGTPSTPGSLLTIGNAGADNNDHIALMPSGGVGVGTANPLTRLHIYEPMGTKHNTLKGSILIEHGDPGGQSSVVFRSKNNPTSDYGYIAFQDDVAAGSGGESNLLIIGVENDPQDSIALMTKGNVGVGSLIPRARLHVQTYGSPVLGNQPGMMLINEVPTGREDANMTLRTVSPNGSQFISFESNSGLGYTGWSAGTDGLDNQTFKISSMTTPMDFNRFPRFSIQRQNGNVGIGIAKADARLHIFEDVGTAPSPQFGTMVLEHGNSGGQSSIVFRSRSNFTSDYGYISYSDNVEAGKIESSLLTIGVQNDTEDHIALMPSGNVGIGVTAPIAKLHVAAKGNSPSTNGILVYNETEANNQDAIVLLASKGVNGGSPYVVMDVGGVAGWTIGTDNRDNQSFKLAQSWGQLSTNTFLTVKKDGKMGVGTNDPKGRLHIYEPTGTAPTCYEGSLVLEHGNTGGQSSIVFRSRNNGTSDYAYISYRDDITLGSGGEAAVLCIGIENDYNDHIALMTRDGNIGFGRMQPKTFLDVKTGAVIGTGETIVGQHAVENRGTKVRFGACVDEYVGMDIVLRDGTAGCGNSADITFNTWECNTSTSREVVRINGSGHLGIGNSNPRAPLHVSIGRATAVISGNGAFGNADTWYNGWDTNVQATLGIFTEWGIGTRSYFFCHYSMVMSDARIKNIVGRSNPETDLEVLNRIQITDYTYKDEALHGSKVHKKVIAQELEAVYPEAVNQRTEVIPDLLANATTIHYDETSEICTLETGSELNLQKGDRVELVEANGVRELFEVVASTGSRISIKINHHPGETCFLYGREVNDFRFVDYDSLTTLNISAIQALTQQIKTMKAEMLAMKAQLDIHTGLN